jgi:cell division initiation protein
VTDQTGPQPTHNFTPDAIRQATFPTSQNGLDAGAVRAYLDRLADHLQQVASEPPERAIITAQTVGIISRAQILAEQAVSDAEQYSRDLIETARTQYQELLRRAESSNADRSDETAAVGAYHDQIPEIEYVRTYSRIAYTQLRAVLDSLAEQVDRLGQLPDLPGQASSNHHAPLGTAEVHRPALPAGDSIPHAVGHVNSDA